jgi:serine/threonine-protein kinase
LTGKPPYPSTKSRDERRQFSRYRDIRPIRQVDPSLPESVTTIVTDLMRIHPYIHYQDPTQVLKDLRVAIRDLVPASDQVAAAGNDDKVSTAPDKSSTETILCVEERVRQQDSLRKYFSKHGYRVLLLGDFQRALNRLQSDRPKALVLMSDALGHHTESYYQKAVAAARPIGTAVMLVLSDHHRKLASNIEETDISRVLSHQPVTLRTIRKAMEEVWSKTS